MKESGDDQNGMNYKETIKSFCRVVNLKPLLKDHEKKVLQLTRKTPYISDAPARTTDTF